MILSQHTILYPARTTIPTGVRISLVLTKYTVGKHLLGFVHTATKAIIWYMSSTYQQIETVSYSITEQ